MSEQQPVLIRVFLTFARNSLVREMTFRTNFFIQCVSSISWTLMNLGFYLIIFHHLNRKPLADGSGWQQNEFFVFLATTWIVFSIVQAFFMPNVQEFSELIRTGNLDFVFLKPIDTQFLISFAKVDWSALANFVMGILLLTVGVWRLTTQSNNPLSLNLANVLLYWFYVACGVAILYSLMISLAATSIWLGRNQSLYDFWFYITNFSRYPMEIYARSWGWSLWGLFTFVIPILIVVNVPARILARPLRPEGPWLGLPLSGFAILATFACLVISRRVFTLALQSYRSASS